MIQQMMTHGTIQKENHCRCLATDPKKNIFTIYRIGVFQNIVIIF